MPRAPESTHAAGEVSRLLHAWSGGDSRALDVELEREVRSLLDSYDQAGTFLERPAMARPREGGHDIRLDEEADPFVGRDVSHYRIWADEIARRFRASNDEPSAQAIERAFKRGGKRAAAEWVSGTPS